MSSGAFYPLPGRRRPAGIEDEVIESVLGQVVTGPQTKHGSLMHASR